MRVTGALFHTQGGLEVDAQCRALRADGTPMTNLMLSMMDQLGVKAEKLGVPAKLIENADSLDRDWFKGIKHIGLTAGASAPENLVQDVVKRLKDWGASSVRTLDGAQENVSFPLPKGLSGVANT